VVTWQDHVRAIRAAPDDDAPRLVCADWLLDRGDPRGEFVAVDVRRHRSAPKDPDYGRLSDRHDELHRQYAATWAAPLVTLGVARPFFHRGFVGYASLLDDAVANLGAICRLEPVVEVYLGGDDDDAYATAAAALELAQIRRFQLSGGPATAALLASPWLGAIDELELSETCEFGEALAGSALRPRHLELRGDAALVARLAGSPLVERLERWKLIDPDDRTVGALAASPPPALRVLQISDYGGGGGLAHFGDWLEPIEVRLRREDRDEGVLVEATFFAGRPRRLGLGGFDHSMAGFLATPVLDGVAELELHQLTDALADALRRSRHLGALRRLRLARAPRAPFVLPGVDVVVDP
jgi:uncharacterized protein (TIGR02996 family)